MALVLAFLSCGEQGLLFIAVCGLLIVLASLLWSAGSAVVGPSCSAACGIFLGLGWNRVPLSTAPPGQSPYRFLCGLCLDSAFAWLLWTFEDFPNFWESCFCLTVQACISMFSVEGRVFGTAYSTVLLNIHSRTYSFSSCQFCRIMFCKKFVHFTLIVKCTIVKLFIVVFLYYIFFISLGSLMMSCHFFSLILVIFVFFFTN